MSIQAPDSIVMIRPRKFISNPQTASDNSFQFTPEIPLNQIAEVAQGEFDAAVSQLQNAGVNVHVFQDERDDTPDSIFPNNWFSTHPGGYVALYPMYAPNRRQERRQDVIEILKAQYRVQEVIDFSGFEQDNMFLEGTGAMVIDHIGRLVFVARSRRADPVLLERFCTRFGYEPITFDATDDRGVPVYHTNVLMMIGTHVAMVGLDMVTDEERRNTIVTRLEETGRTVIRLSAAQIGNFAGNAIELTGRQRPLLALSQRAHDALEDAQTDILSQHMKLLPLNLNTIECAGGSARCMIAGLHLARRPI